MNDTSSKQVAPYGLRMAPDLKERVAASADRNSRSMNVEINHALEDYLAREAEREKGFRWLPPDQQVDPRLLRALEMIAEAEGRSLDFMLDGALSLFIEAKKAEFADADPDAPSKADSQLSGLIGHLESRAGGDPEYLAHVKEMKEQYAVLNPMLFSGQAAKNDKTLSDAEMQELKDAVSATVAKELARLLGRE